VSDVSASGVCGIKIRDGVVKDTVRIRTSRNWREAVVQVVSRSQDFKLHFPCCVIRFSYWYGVSERLSMATSMINKNVKKKNGNGMDCKNQVDRRNPDSQGQGSDAV
jgi:sulfur relay (sulfurtransferase) DsrC/TusE family protein